MDILGTLTLLSFVLLVGVICTHLSRWLKLPGPWLLLLSGFLLKHVGGFTVIEDTLLKSIGIFALIMIAFDSSSGLSSVKPFSMRVPLVFSLITFILISGAVWFMFGSLYLGLLFGSLMIGTDFLDKMSFKKRSHRIIELLKNESLVTTPICISLVFGFAGMVNLTGTQWVQQLITGIGIGVVLGIITLKIMQSKFISINLTLLTTAFLTYVLTENLGGNGILGVIVLGLMIGIMQKKQITLFEGLHSELLTTLVFVFLGFTLALPEAGVLVKSMVLFIFYVGIRLLAAYLGAGKLNLREKMFVSLHAPKGIAVGVIILVLGTQEIIIQMAVMFMIYTLILSTLTTYSADWFLERH